MLTDVVKRLASESGKTMRQIANEMQVSEKTLKRLMSGETGSPSMYTFANFLRVCGADIDDILDIFAEIQLYIVREPAAEINKENESLTAELSHARNEINTMTAVINALTAERDYLREKNDKLRDELLDLYRTGRDRQ